MYRNALKCPYKAGTFTTNSADSPQIDPQIEQNLYTKYWTGSHKYQTDSVPHVLLLGQHSWSKCLVGSAVGLPR